MADLFSNDFVSGGLILVILGSLLTYFRWIPNFIWHRVKSKLVTEVEVVKGDVFYQWLENWLSHQDYMKRCRRLQISCIRNDSSDSKAEATESGEHRWKILSVPAPGEHFFWYAGHPAWLHKERDKLKDSGQFMGFFETIRLTFVTRDQTVIDGFLSEVRDFNVSKDDSRLAVYTNQWSAWRLMSLIPPRAIGTVVLNDRLLEKLVRDVDTFLSARDWYARHSIPYRRGYLFYGPPGNGKSSAVVALASRFKKDLYILSPGNRVTDNELVELFLELPEDAFLLIEDVDQVFNPTKADGDGSDSKVANRVTRSGFLNVLDGAAAKTGRVIFMTTNFRDKLDDALIRSGRADVKAFIGPPSTRQVDCYLGKFFDRGSPAISEIKSNVDGNVSMADLQEEVVRRKWGFRID